MNYKELKSFIKANRTGNEEFFGDYTHKTTAELQKLVNKFQNKQGNVVSQAVAEPTKPSCSSQQTTVHEVIDVLIFALDKLKNLPSYAKEQEDKATHRKIMDFEALLLGQEE